MIENNNKAIIKKITSKSIKSNKTRNIFVILAIVLTTFMISSVFSMGFSFVKNYQTAMIRTKGTTAGVTLNNPTNKQINDILNSDNFKHVGTKIRAGKILHNNLTKNESKITLNYCDNVNFKFQTVPAISDIAGEYPTKANEIMASKFSLNELGIKNPKLGMGIDLTYEINGKRYTDKFTLKGFYEDYNSLSKSGNIMVSKEFINKNSLSLEKNGTAYMNFKSLNNTKAYDYLEKEFSLNKGQKFNYLEDQKQKSMSTGMGVASIALLISLFIVISGYLLIYNVLYIGVSKDISFYGLLKTIGTSPSQIKKIVRGQALKLSFIGIAIGLLLGALVSFWAVPFALTLFQSGGYGEIMPSEVSFNPFIFIGAAIFSLLTTVLSCRKPAKIASSISPVEAARFTGGKTKKTKKNTRKSTNGGKIYKMAWYNVFREKKRAIIVFLSLFMGMITFLSVDTFVSSMGVDNYIKRYVPHSFNIENSIEAPGNYGEDFIEKIKNINGVENVEASLSTKFNFKYEDWFLAFIKNDLSMGGANSISPEELSKMMKNDPEYLKRNIIGLDDSLVEKLNKESKTNINIEDFKKGKIALFTPAISISPEYKNEISSLTGKYISGKEVKSGVEKSYKMEQVPESWDLTLPSNRVIGMPIIFVSNNAIKELTKSPSIEYINIDVDDKNEVYIKNELTNLIKGNTSYKLTARSTVTEEFKSFKSVMNILGGGMAVILVLIGILNFINIMVTSINVRMKELAVMESVGMTKKQIKKMLTFEGLYYAGITSTLMLTLGMGIVYIVAKLAANVADYAEFIFPGWTLVSLTSVIFIVCLSIPRIVYGATSKKSVVERLRSKNN